MTLKDYISLFQSNLTKTKSKNNPCRESWIKTERAYKKMTRENRFSTYESFKAAKSRFLKTKKILG